MQRLDSLVVVKTKGLEIPHIGSDWTASSPHGWLVDTNTRLCFDSPGPCTTKLVDNTITTGGHPAFSQIIALAGVQYHGVSVETGVDVGFLTLTLTLFWIRLLRRFQFGKRRSLFLEN